MIFKMGRKDISDSEGSLDLPEVADPYGSPSEIEANSQRMGLTDQEFVALMGRYTLGFADKEQSGRKSRWVMNPYVFDNTYFKEVLLAEKSKYYKGPIEGELLSNSSYKEWVEAYAQDQDLFFDHYATAHSKVSGLGQEDNLMCEFEEPKAIHKFDFMG